MSSQRERQYSLSRRRLLQTGVVTSFSAALGGCVEDAADAEAILGVDPAELTDITFVQWPGLFREAAASAYVNPFEELAGVEVTLLDHPLEVESLPDMIIAGRHQFDLISHWNYTLPRGVKANSFHPIRMSNVPNRERIATGFDPVTADYDPGDLPHHVPYSIGANGIVYDAEELDRPTTWDRLLDGDLPGELWMPRTASMIVGMVARQEGVELSEVPANEAKLWARLAQYADVVDHWWTDPSVLDDALASGRVSAAGYWSGRAYALKQAGHPIEFTVPDEGTNAWIEVLSIPADVPEPARRTAEALVNYALRPERIVAFADAIGYATAFELDREHIPEGHIYQNHPTWDRIGSDHIAVWDADVLTENEARWDAKLDEILE